MKRRANRKDKLLSPGIDIDIVVRILPKWPDGTPKSLNNDFTVGPTRKNKAPIGQPFARRNYHERQY